jgi:hypothetical protein
MILGMCEDLLECLTSCAPTYGLITVSTCFLNSKFLSASGDKLAAQMHRRQKGLILIIT